MNVELLRPIEVFAHVGPPPAPASLMSSWTFDPVLLAATGIAGLLYIRGLRSAWKRPKARPIVRPWRAQCFAAALAVILIALISPLDALSSALFSAHMVQHLLLIAVAAPLLVLSAPAALMRLGLPRSCRRGFSRIARDPPPRQLFRFLRATPAALLIATTMLWLWHLPSLYELALRSQTVHALEHALLFATAVVFWYSVLPKSFDTAARRPGRLLVGVAALAAMTVQGTVLGIAIAFSSSPWYPTYAVRSAAWGLGPIVDQQIAGLVMWIPAGAIYIVAALFLLGVAIAGPSRRAQPEAMSPARSRTLDVVEG